MAEHLVFQTAFPGDLFLCIPLLKRIKEWDPQSRVTLACRPGLGDFFLNTGLADEVVAINKKDKAQMRKAMGALRSRQWGVIFSPHESFRTAVMLKSLRAKHKVGFAKWWNRIFFDKRVQKPIDFPDALRQLSLLTPLDSRLAENFGQDELQGLRNSDSRETHVQFAKIPEWASMRIMGSKSEGKTVFMAPGSTWNTKRWTPRGYIETAARLREMGYDVTLVGSPAERELCTLIAKNIPGVKNCAGETSLAGLVELLRTGVALITNDSGSMHAAAVSGLPTVAVFGPTVLELGFRPWNDESVVVQLDLDCRPCGKHGHEKCPLGHHHCMEKLEAATVIRAFNKIIPKKPSSAPNTI